MPDPIAPSTNTFATLGGGGGGGSGPGAYGELLGIHRGGLGGDTIIGKVPPAAVTPNPVAPAIPTFVPPMDGWLFEQTGPGSLAGGTFSTGPKVLGSV